MDAETWKPVVGYEGIYSVSDMGRVSRTKPWRNSGTTLTPVFDGKHYYRVSLSKDNKSKIYSIHRLVCAAFIGIPKGMVCNHKNGDKSDNRLSNLEVVTQKQNEHHKWAVLDRGACNNIKLDWDKVSGIRRLYGDGFSLSRLSKMFGTSKSNISAIVNYKTWDLLADRHPPL
jgi:hypothetical protein